MQRAARAASEAGPTAKESNPVDRAQGLGRAADFRGGPRFTAEGSLVPDAASWGHAALAAGDVRRRPGARPGRGEASAAPHRPGTGPGRARDLRRRAHAAAKVDAARQRGIRHFAGHRQFTAGDRDRAGLAAAARAAFRPTADARSRDGGRRARQVVSYCRCSSASPCAGSCRMPVRVCPICCSSSWASPSRRARSRCWLRTGRSSARSSARRSWRSADSRWQRSASGT